MVLSSSRIQNLLQDDNNNLAKTLIVSVGTFSSAKRAMHRGYNFKNTLDIGDLSIYMRVCLSI
jgi:hypothetical protein